MLGSCETMVDERGRGHAIAPSSTLLLQTSLGDLFSVQSVPASTLTQPPNPDCHVIANPIAL
jgi:hypothetical protein